MPRFIQACFTPRTLAFLLGVFLSAGYLSGCGSDASKQSQGGSMPSGLPVELHTVETAPVEQPIRVLGRVDSDTSVWIRPRVVAHVVSIPVQSGQWVEAGQTLMVMDAARQGGIVEAQAAQIASLEDAIRIAETAVTAQEARVQATQAELKRAKNELQRNTALYEQQALATADYDTSKRNAEQAQATTQTALAELNGALARLKQSQTQRNVAIKQLQAEQQEAHLYSLTAPFAGKVGDILPKVGELVEPTKDALELTKQANPFVKAQIPIEASRHVTIGMKARLVDSQQSPLAEAVVVSLSDRVTLESQTRLVRLKVLTNTQQFFQGQYVQAHLFPLAQPCVVLPFHLVTFMAGQPFAYVPQQAPLQPPSDSSAVPSHNTKETTPPPTASTAMHTVVGLRPLVLGALANNRYIVLQGLQAGERVIASNLQSLQPNAPIQVINQGMPPLPPTHPQQEAKH